MKKQCAVMMLTLIGVFLYAATPYFDFTSGVYGFYSETDYSNTSEFKTNQENDKMGKSWGIGGIAQLGLGVQFDLDILSGFTLLAEGGVGLGNNVKVDREGKERNTMLSVYGGFVSELLLLNGMINPGIGVNWDLLGFSIKPSLSTMALFGKSTKAGIGIPIYIKDGVYTGWGFNLFVSVRGGIGIDFMNGILTAAQGSKR